MIPKVYILILNWNGWVDTIECLESVFRIFYKNYQVIVCDNGSEDGSLEKIKLWAEGKLPIKNLPKRNLQYLTTPPVKKPISYKEYHSSAFQKEGIPKRNSNLILIQTGSNLGFAGGNNIGLKYALLRNDFKFVWLLNNDTVITKDSLTELVKKMELNPKAGICGSTLFYYNQPHKIQALGGARFNKWFASPKHLGELLPDLESVNNKLVIKKMDYVVGASMLVSKAFIKEVGFLNEEYFLYFEEIDWITRGKKFFDLEYSPKSLVFHKEGSSIGSNHDPKKRTEISDYYGIKNRIKFTRKYYPWFLPTVFLGFVITFLNRIRRGQFKRIPLLIRAILGKPPHIHVRN